MRTEPFAARALASPGFWAVILLFFVVFGASLGSGFVYDDHLLVVDNPYAHGFEYLARAFSTHFWDVFGQDDRAQRYYRPLVTLSYIVDWQLGAGKPWSFHLGNVVLHTLSVLLALRWARRLLPGPLWVLPVVLFALHPSRAESVYWVSGRTDLMATVFLLLAVEAAWRARGAGRGWWFLCGVSALCALLSKELAVVLPFLLLAENAGHDAPRGRFAVIGSAVLSAGYVLVRAFVFPLRLDHVALSPRLALLTAEGYLERVVWPWPQTMFAHSLLFARNARWTDLAIGGGVLGLVVALAAVAWRRDRTAFWLLVALGVALAPVSNLLPSGLPVLTSDRFLYLPLLLGALGITHLFRSRLLRWTQTTRLTRLLLGGSCALMGAVLLMRLPPFEDNESFWNHELALDACNPPGLEYRAQQAARLGDLTTAAQLFGRMLNAPCVEETRVHTTLFGKARVRHLALRAQLTPDGDVVGLEHLFDRLAEQSSTSESQNLAAELAVLAARLGHDQAALRHAARVESGDLSRLAAPANLVLALTRLGRYQRARKLLARLRQAKPRALLDHATAKDLGTRIDKAALLTAKAGETSEPQEALALAQAELGAYLRALETLAPVRERSQSTRVLFVQLLVLARLEDDALAELSKTYSEERSRDILEKLRASLPPEVLERPKVPPRRGPGFLRPED